jgi:hypothetical protein
MQPVSESRFVLHHVTRMTRRLHPGLLTKPWCLRASSAARSCLCPLVLDASYVVFTIFEVLEVPIHGRNINELEKSNCKAP